jgi:hypothetical protein
VAGLAIVFRDSFIAGVLNVRLPVLEPYWHQLLSLVRVCGLLLVAIPWTLVIRASKWPTDHQNAALIALYAAVYALLPGVTDGWKTLISDPLVWIALIVSVLLARGKGDSDAGR